MEIIRSNSDLDTFLRNEHSNDKEISLIPTMGHLHEGHMKLISESPKNSFKIVSIYVNDLQFNDKDDFINYPRTFDQDIYSCKKNNVDLVFAPESNLLHNHLDSHFIDLPKFTKFMCGLKRDGHFLGVYKIIKVLFELIKPNYALFGKKDFQQLLLIKYIAKTYFPDVKIIDVDIIRDCNGIALSSRLTRLSTESVQKAKLIYPELQDMKRKLLSNSSFDLVKQETINQLQKNNIITEYLEVRSRHTLEESINDFKNCAIFIACDVDGVRLIDNIEI